MRFRIFLLILFVVSGANAKDSFCEVLQKIPSMGTIFEIQLVRKCSDKDDKTLFLKIKKELDEIESELTLYRIDSPLQRLNENGVLLGSYPHLDFLLRKSLKANKDTGGAFDISIYPVLLMIQESFKKYKKPPSTEELDPLKKLVDVSSISIEEKKISFAKIGMKLTFDGIGKGYAVDRVASIAEAVGVKRYLLNFSGNMRWLGLRADGKKWQLAMWNPVLQNAKSFDTGLAGAMASSGAEINHYSEDLRWHHIIDPISLRPPMLWSQVTVVALGTKVTAMDCDVLSTATYILNFKKMKSILQVSYPLYRVWAVDLTGKMRLATP